MGSWEPRMTFSLLDNLHENGHYSLMGSQNDEPFVEVKVDLIIFLFKCTTHSKTWLVGACVSWNMALMSVVIMMV
jgi:hypothetical protein